MVQAQLREVRPGEVEVPPAPRHLVGIHLGRPVRATCRVRELVHQRLQKHGDTDIVPPGTGGSWRDDAACTVLLLSVEEELVSGQAEHLGLNLQMDPKLGVRDRQLEHLAWALQGLSETDSPTDRLYRDSLAVAVAARLLQHYSGLPAGSQWSLAASTRRRSAVLFWLGQMCSGCRVGCIMKSGDNLPAGLHFRFIASADLLLLSIR